MTKAQLPPLPVAIRTLTDEESTALARRHPDLSPSPERCPTCRGHKTFRWYAFGDSGERIADIADYECPCDDQWILNRYLLHCGIGLNYQRYAWDDYIAPKPGDVLDWLVDADAYVNAGFGFVLTGSVGNGKTMLALLALKNLLAQGHDGYFTTFSEMIDYVTASWRDKADRAWFTRRVRNAGILVIDDLGRETRQGRTRNRAEVAAGDTEVEKREVHDFMRSAFEEVVRHRIANAKPTIITTNETFGALGRHYSTNVFSLLNERSQVVEFHNADYRPESKSIFKQEVTQGLTRPIVLA